MSHAQEAALALGKIKDKSAKMISSVPEQGLARRKIVFCVLLSCVSVHCQKYKIMFIRQDNLPKIKHLSLQPFQQGCQRDFESVFCDIFYFVS